MNQNTCVHLVVAIILSVSYFQLAFLKIPEYKYLQFSNQSGPPEKKAANFATLKSEDLAILSSNRLTICGSIYIGFFRGYQLFYAVRTNRQEKLYLSLTIDNQDTTEEIYTAVLNYFGSITLSINGAKLRLNPHSWSHACTSVDGDSGVVMVVINGVLAFNTTIKTKEFTENFPTVFQNNLVLGASKEVVRGKTYQTQSEASVTNVNVFSGTMHCSEMVNITSKGLCTDGDVVSWSKSLWMLTGSVEEVIDEDIRKISQFPHLFRIADGFNRWSDCTSLCPRIQAGGKVPFTRHLWDAKHLSQQYSEGWFWAPYVYQTDGNFTDYYTNTDLDPNFWGANEPNGGLKEQCTFWMGEKFEVKLFDIACNFWSKKLQCLCQFDRKPIFRLRGLCHGSKIDAHYTLTNLNRRSVFMGLKNTVISFRTALSEWTLNVNLEATVGSSTAEEASFIMGRHEWSIEGDSGQCNKGKPYTAQLKMSGCNTEGEFTCDDGQCVTMEQRCDQVPDCRDESDERRCEMLVKKEGYNKHVPPFIVSSIDRSIVPVPLNVSIDLLKVVNIGETYHKIDFQFKITLEWNENNRVLYHNLKKDTSLNVLSTADIRSLWLPLVIYDNTDQKEMTRLGMGWEWNTPISIIRKGDFTRSGLNMVDEKEIFKGRENTLLMQQVYTWQFQCKYNLQDYPFDTQVRKSLRHRCTFCILGLHN